MADLMRYHRERYGESVAFPERCASRLFRPKVDGMVWVHQCTRKRGHGPEGAFCKQHARQHEERKNG